MECTDGRTDPQAYNYLYPLQQGFDSLHIYTNIWTSGGTHLTCISISQRRLRPMGWEQRHRHLILVGKVRKRVQSNAGWLMMASQKMTALGRLGLMLQPPHPYLTISLLRQRRVSRVSRGFSPSTGTSLTYRKPGVSSLGDSCLELGLGGSRQDLMLVKPLLMNHCMDMSPLIPLHLLQ